MKPFILGLLHALWTDESAFKRWLFGILGFVVTLASLVFAEGVDVAFTWNRRQWAAKVITALIAMAMSMINPAGKLKAAQQQGAPQP